ARKGLEAIGLPALDALHRARQNADLEVNRRAARLVKVIRANARAAAPAAIRALGGRYRLADGDTGGHVESVDFSGTSVGDADIVLIPWLDDLERLNLSGTQVTSAGLAYLEEIKGLRRLDLSNTRVTDT